MTDTTLSALVIRDHISRIRDIDAEACAFLAGLFRKFEPRRQELLASRVARQERITPGTP